MSAKTEQPKTAADRWSTHQVMPDTEMGGFSVYRVCWHKRGVRSYERVSNHANREAALAEVANAE